MKYLLSLVLLFIYFTANATPSPFQPHVWDEFVTVRSEIATDEAFSRHHSQTFEFDVTAQTTASGSTITLGSLPANASILKSYFYVETAFVSASGNTLGLGCLSTTDLYTATSAVMVAYATDVTVKGAINYPNTSATASLVNTGSSGCNVVATIGAGLSGITAGVVHLFIEYFVRD